MILQASGKTNKSDSESSTLAAMKKTQVAPHQTSTSTTTTTTTTTSLMNAAQQHHDGSEFPVVQGMTACPCCNRRLDQGRQTLGETVAPPVYDSLFNAEDESTGDMDEEDCMMPGILADGDTYHVKKVLVQGWVYKKGTGMDWIGSRAWKPRWACLVVSFVWIVHLRGARFFFYSIKLADMKREHTASCYFFINLRCR